MLFHLWIVHDVCRMQWSLKGKYLELLMLKPMNRMNSRFGRVMLVMIYGMFLLATRYSLVSYAQPVSGAEFQDTAVIKQKVEEFLLVQTIGAPGKVSVKVGAIDQHIKLANCAALESSLPAGSRAWGKTTVAVRCTIPSPWTIYVQAKVSVMADYLITAAPLAQGHTVSAEDTMTQNGDLTLLPPGIFTNTAQVVGQTVGMSLSAGTVLRQEMLRSPAAIKQGQTVRLVSIGKGFTVSAEANALNNASAGQVAQARAANGSVVSGIAKGNGEIEVNF